MRLLHLSDLHLGFRQFQRQTPAGINQREADIAGVFSRVVDQAIELAPDLFCLAGDVFHSVRPSNPAILHAFGEFSRFRRALPDTIVVMVAGNHDTPRSSETGCILRLFATIGVHVVDTDARRLAFPSHDLAVFGVPDVGGARISLDPDPSARHNVLILHGRLPEVRPSWASEADPGVLEVTTEEIGVDRWSYVALGHHHVFRQIAPHFCYSGAMEYASVNIWGELAEEKAARLPGKGFVEYDLESGKRTFHPIRPARPVIDLLPIQATGLTAGDLDAAISRNITRIKGGLADKIVRQLVRDVPRHVVRELDHKTLREYRAAALHFQLDARRPELLRTSLAPGAGGRRPSLAEIVRDRLMSRTLSPDIDRQALIELGLRYLADAETRERVDTMSPAGSPGLDGGLT
ncbi:MAG: metallophosphoesterase family protein [Gemmatimonadota bacterium]